MQQRFSNRDDNLYEGSLFIFRKTNLMLSSVRSPAATNNNLVHIGGLPFVRTPIKNGVNGAGLLVAKTPLTFNQRWKIADQLDGLTHGQISMNRRTGVADVLARGPKSNPTQIARHPWLLDAQRPDLRENIDDRSFTGDLVGEARVLPLHGVFFLLADRPAVNMTWFESAAVAAYLTDTQPDYVVRMMTNREYSQMVTCGGKLSEKQIIAMAHLNAETSASVEPSVFGPKVEKRTNEWGIVDAFGNVHTWTNSIGRPADMHSSKSVNDVSRLIRGASFLVNSQEASVAALYACGPGLRDARCGVRFVAVPRTHYR